MTRIYLSYTFIITFLQVPNVIVVSESGADAGGGADADAAPAEHVRGVAEPHRRAAARERRRRPCPRRRPAAPAAGIAGSGGGELCVEAGGEEGRPGTAGDEGVPVGPAGGPGPERRGPRALRRALQPRRARRDAAAAAATAPECGGGRAAAAGMEPGGAAEEGVGKPPRVRCHARRVRVPLAPALVSPPAAHRVIGPVPRRARRGVGRPLVRRARGGGGSGGGGGLRTDADAADAHCAAAHDQAVHAQQEVAHVPAAAASHVHALSTVGCGYDRSDGGAVGSGGGGVVGG
jgi:hypothetical protein